MRSSEVVVQSTYPILLTRFISTLLATDETLYP